jgi:hypothetical protein
VPDRYWGNLLDASVFRYIGDGLVPGLAETGAVPWPWPAIAPAEFVGLAELSPGRRVMSADEAAVLGLSDNGGVVQRVYLLGPDGETIYLALADAAGRIELMAVRTGVTGKNGGERPDPTLWVHRVEPEADGRTASTGDCGVRRDPRLQSEVVHAVTGRRQRTMHDRTARPYSTDSGDHSAAASTARVTE